MIGFPLNPNPPLARLTVAGKFGRFLQVDADDAKLMTSQVSMSGSSPPQMSSFWRKLNTKYLYLYLGYFCLEKGILFWDWLG